MTSTISQLYENIQDELQNNKIIKLPISSISGKNIRVTLCKTTESSLKYSIFKLGTKKEEILIDNIFIYLPTGVHIGKFAIDKMFELRYDNLYGRFITDHCVYQCFFNILCKNSNHFKHLQFIEVDFSGQHKNCGVCSKLILRRVDKCSHKLCLECQLQMKESKCPICNVIIEKVCILNERAVYSTDMDEEKYLTKCHVNLNTIFLNWNDVTNEIPSFHKDYAYSKKCVQITSIHDIPISLKIIVENNRNNYICITLKNKWTCKIIQMIEFNISRSQFLNFAPKQQTELYLGILTNLRYDTNLGYFTIMPVISDSSIKENIQSMWAKEITNQKKRKHIEIELLNICKKCNEPLSDVPPKCCIFQDGICVRCQCFIK